MNQRRVTMSHAISLKAFVAAAFFALAVPRVGLAAGCWQGWGYWVDPQTRAYKSQELLLVTEGTAVWAAGQAVTLRVLERATGRIDESIAPIIAMPLEPRIYYRGNANYVDGIADVQGAVNRLVFGLSEIAASLPALPEMKAYTDWACGLERG